MPTTGIGSELQRARLMRGKSIEEASRETHIREDYLHALERESFEALLGEVYVRGFLRSYSTYLGLDPSRVVTVYNRHFGSATPVVPDQRPGPVKVARAPHPHLHHPVRHHPSWAFLVTMAFFVLTVLGAVGLLSRSRAIPRAEAPRPPASIPVLPPTVTLSIQARAPLRAVVVLDAGEPRTFDLRRGEGRSFVGNSVIRLSLDHGGSALLTVNARSLGEPGDPAAPYAATYTPTSFRRTPSPSAPGP